MSDLGIPTDSVCGDNSKAVTKDEYIEQLEARCKELEKRISNARKTAADYYYYECVACEIKPDEGIYEGFKGLNL